MAGCQQDGLIYTVLSHLKEVREQKEEQRGIVGLDECFLLSI
jgi:hypothetical protein